MMEKCELCGKQMRIDETGFWMVALNKVLCKACGLTNEGEALMKSLDPYEMPSANKEIRP